MVTYAAAFASSLGIFNVYFVFLLSFLGNIVGDSLFYFLGKLGSHKIIFKIAEKFKKEHHLSNLKKQLERNPGKAITVVKLTPGLPMPGLIMIGSSQISFRIFLKYTTFISAIYSLSFCILGYFSGSAFNSISKFVGYSDYLIGGVIVLTIAIWLLLRRVEKTVSSKLEKE
jgi:membrane protein DedA with SNARE-associated domain